jgi:hypothetical protein
VRYVPLYSARQFVAEHHRHLPKVRGGIIAVGCYDAERLCGVAILGRPSARLFDNGERMELVRCATDGTSNAGSALYGAARRVSNALGMGQLVTYTLPEESGASLRGAGWVEDGQTAGGEWTRSARPRAAAHDPRAKTRWRA